MGEKKQKEARMKRVKQILIVVACVLFVVLMILSGMNLTHVFPKLRSIQPGDSVVVDYTLYDSGGDPILTSDQQRAARGNIIFTYQRLTLAAGQNPVKSVYPVPIYTGTSETTTEFAILPTEYAAINQAVIGMKSGDQKRVQIPLSSEPKLWDAATITQSGLNVSQLSAGDLIPMAMSDNPEAMASNSSSTYLRIGRITNITGDGIVVDVNYPAADISIISVNAKS